MDSARWRPGDRVTLHEVWQGRVWSASPVTVVEDTGCLVVLHLAEGMRCKQPRTLDGGRPAMPLDDWLLVDHVWTGGDALYLATLGVPHAVLVFWNEGHRPPRSWYVNLQEPLRRTPVGFVYMDQVLDVVVSPDRSSWRWKDEEDFAEAQALGIYTPVQAHRIRAEGERALELIRDRRPPFDRDWERWSPDPSWPVPELPAGWDVPPE
jgi:hypothetical protein